MENQVVEEKVVEPAVVEEVKEEVKEIVLHSKRCPQPTIKTKCDARDYDVYKWAYDDKHVQKRVFVKKRPFWQEIQSFKDETGVYNVLRMIQARGEDPAILDASRGNGFYGDISDMPENIHELHQVGEKSKAILAAYNKMLGTDYSIDGLLQAMADGSLDALIKAKEQKVQKEAPKEEEVNG